MQGPSGVMERRLEVEEVCRRGGLEHSVWGVWRREIGVARQ